jgi:hypothetical protein
MTLLLRCAVAFVLALLSRVAGVATVAVALPLVVLAACSTPAGAPSAGSIASDNRQVAQVGFLSAPARLQAGPDAEGALCWRQPGTDWKRYDKVMIERIQLYLDPKTSADRAIDPTDLKTLIDYFDAALVKNIAPIATLVDKPGPGVLRVRLALTSLVPTNTAQSLAGTAIPYGFIAEAGAGAASGRPAGSTPYMGQTGLQAQFRDGASGAVIGECADTTIGLKYAADLDRGAAGAAQAWMNGYTSSFTSWNYAQDAFNKWSAAFAKRLVALRSSDG